MAIKLSPGTVVQLKSGGPKMTVKGGKMGEVLCQWFDNGKPMTESFPEESLETVDEQMSGSTFLTPKL